MFVWFPTWWSPNPCSTPGSAAYQAGATWTIEGDLEKCFDRLPHGVILTCLRKRIKDERFIDLIRKMLQAGVIEKGRYQHTYSGTPQGGLASPIISNIVLHEFDVWMEQRWKANPPPQTRQECRARSNPEYNHYTSNLQRWRRQLHGRIPWDIKLLMAYAPRSKRLSLPGNACRRHYPGGRSLTVAMPTTI